MKEWKTDKLTVKQMPNRTEMGEVAAKDIHDCMVKLLSEKDEINMIFAAAPSQNDVLASLVACDDIEWNRVNAYHMDEYIGLAEEYKSAGFANFLNEHIFEKVAFKSVNLINCTAQDAQAECARYGKLLVENPTDIVVCGIGENGHIAFNDPWVADFNDPEVVKVVELDEVCRQQQVNDGCFPSIDCVPKQAMTLTCPTLTKAPFMFCIVPAKTKAVAVKATLHKEINEECPATVLRCHDNAVLYLDGDSSALL